MDIATVINLVHAEQGTSKFKASKMSDELRQALAREFDPESEYTEHGIKVAASKALSGAKGQSTKIKGVGELQMTGVKGKGVRAATTWQLVPAGASA